MFNIKLFILILTIPLLSGCFSSPFKTVSYNAAFEMIDSSKDGVITLNEFTSHFPEAGKQFPADADADNDGQIYPDEWFEFRETQGYLKPAL